MECCVLYAMCHVIQLELRSLLSEETRHILPLRYHVTEEQKQREGEFASMTYSQNVIVIQTDIFQFLSQALKCVNTKTVMY